MRIESQNENKHFFFLPVRSFVRTCISDGNNPFGIKSGFDGLVRGDLEIMTWEKVDGWVSQGGALLGTKRTLPNADNFGDIAVQLQKYNIEVSI